MERILNTVDFIKRNICIAILNDTFLFHLPSRNHGIHGTKYGKFDDLVPHATASNITEQFPGRILLISNYYI